MFPLPHLHPVGVQQQAATMIEDEGIEQERLRWLGLHQAKKEREA